MFDAHGPWRWASIDGALRKSGYVLWDGVEMLDSGLVLGIEPDAWDGVFVHVDAVVLEDGYIGRNPQTGLTLARARGTIEGYARLGLCEVWDPVMASKWRRVVGISSRLDRASQKQAALAMCAWLATPPASRRPPKKAQSIWRDVHLPMLERVPEDVAEAALLGLAYQALSGAL